MEVLQEFTRRENLNAQMSSVFQRYLALANHVLSWNFLPPNYILFFVRLWLLKKNDYLPAVTINNAKCTDKDWKYFHLLRFHLGQNYRWLGKLLKTHAHVINMAKTSPFILQPLYLLWVFHIAGGIRGSTNVWYPGMCICPPVLLCSSSSARSSIFSLQLLTLLTELGLVCVWVRMAALIKA